MKKYIFGLLSFVFLAVLAISGGTLFSTNFSASAEDIVIIETTNKFLNVFTMSTTYNNPDVTIRLNTHLDFEGVDLSAISEGKNTFMGTFDGNGYTISNITLTSKCLYYGIIPYAKNATIKNLRVGGDVEFVFDEENIQEVYAGVILGYGENVVIKNCELDNTIVDIDLDTVSYDEITIPVNTNINFGVIAGKLKGNPNASNQSMPANIVDCVNFYDTNVVLNKFSIARIGGLVGALENCYMLDTMNFGKITYSKDPSLISENLNYQYFGGLAGVVNGSGLNIRNNIFGGQISSFEDVTGVNALVGAIFGGTTSTNVDNINVNFDYYTQSGLRPSGDNYVTEGSKVALIETLNKAFLTNSENFDQSVKSWDFEKTWILSNSKFHIQNFMLFEYYFNNILDRNQILENPLFSLSGDPYGSPTFFAQHGKDLDISLTIKSEYQGFYYLNENNVFILLNNNQYNGDYILTEVKNADDIITGYVITIDVNATTAGTYSFIVSQRTYDCLISVSDDAVNLSQGGVRVLSSTVQSLPSPEFHMTFTYNSDVKQVVAESEKGSIYSFDHWELYYKNSFGEYETEPAEFDQATESTVTIAFGSAPFIKEFKLVAFFTDEKAIMFDLGEIDTTIVKSIRVGDVEYISGTPIAMSPNKVVNIEIVTYKNYILNAKAIANMFTELYADNPSPYPVEKEPIVNEDGETTYGFTIDLNYANTNIPDNLLQIKVNAYRDTSNDNNDLLWLFIALPIVAVLAIGLIIFFVVRKKRGGGKSSGKTKTKVKEKKVDYRNDYV